MTRESETDPFAMLERCHRRVEERLAELMQDPADARVVADVLDYFERSMTRHEADEEESLFPRLRGVAELAGVLAALEREHAEHARLHEELKAARGAQVAQVAARLQAAYARHIEREESELFPSARRLLDPSAQRMMAAEMEARRPARGRGGGEKRRP